MKKPNFLRPKMKKWIKIVLLISSFWMTPLICKTQKEVRGHELSLFVEDVFNVLKQVKSTEHLEIYEHSKDPLIQNLAGQFISAFEEKEKHQNFEKPICDLGRLIKCCADKDYQMPYTLDIKELGEKIEKDFSYVLDQKTNYHKLMIESLAEEKWDIALYAYLKIAEERSVKK